MIVTAGQIRQLINQERAMTEKPWDSSPEDVAEQQTALTPEEDQPLTPVTVPWDADPVDAAEQSAEVPLDEEDWR
jgi:hypothetical protein